MLKSAASKAMRVGRATVFAIGLAVVLAVVFGISSKALAGTGVGAVFNLGQTNSVDALSKLVGSTTSSMLRIDNNGTGSALQLLVEPNRPPLIVSAGAGKATNLNADKLDGKDSGEFVQNTGVMTFSVFDSWMSSHSPSDPVTVDYRGDWTTFKRGADAQATSEVRLVPPLPTSLYGKSMLLTGMEICYNTSDPAVALSRVTLTRLTNGGGNHVVDDDTPTDGNQCRKYTGTPQLMGTNSHARVEIYVNWSESTSPTSFSISRTTFFLEPSNTAAAPLG